MTADPARTAQRRWRAAPVLAFAAGLVAVGLAAWWAAGDPGGAAGLAEDGHDHGLLLGRLTAEFARLVGRQELTPGFALLAMAVALALGAGHALAPGHGKLLMATYLVNERGSLRQAVSVAGTVALTHTAGVLVLGVVLAAGLHFVPHRVYTLLTVLSGALVVTVGLSLLRRAWRDRDRPGGHGHGRGHGHGEHAPGAGGHHGRGHGGHGDEGCAGRGARRPGGRGIVAMGLAGGLMPSPSAVVVLLGAVALGRAWYGVLLVAAYGAGMAASLLGIGLLLTRMRDRLERAPRAWMSHRAWRLLPLVTSSAVIVVGVGVATTALLA
ncbi:urease accessory protein UreH domain-containing protein [Catellatospora vulcania]|uniref:urease accessory protein UreH domain-containing protein n=1 Tax=Catellatospora vulcania TaxID=1460450 RepID=UPI0012D43D46|nr:sulfite exporter TauE/SafE family protein [Catellatospora vulcania]